MLNFYLVFVKRLKLEATLLFIFFVDDIVVVDFLYNFFEIISVMLVLILLIIMSIKLIFLILNKFVNFFHHSGTFSLIMLEISSLVVWRFLKVSKFEALPNFRAEYRAFINLLLNENSENVSVCIHFSMDISNGKRPNACTFAACRRNAT